MKHNWKINEDETVNELAWNYEFHSGVICVDCGRVVCVDCNPDYDKLDDCPGNKKYLSQIRKKKEAAFNIIVKYGFCSGCRWKFEDKQCKECDCYKSGVRIIKKSMRL